MSDAPLSKRSRSHEQGNSRWLPRIEPQMAADMDELGSGVEVKPPEDGPYRLAA